MQMGGHTVDGKKLMVVILNDACDVFVQFAFPYFSITQSRFCKAKTA
jgi:hypothetical protein